MKQLNSSKYWLGDLYKDMTKLFLLLCVISQTRHSGSLPKVNSFKAKVLCKILILLLVLCLKGDLSDIYHNLLRPNLDH